MRNSLLCIFFVGKMLQLIQLLCIFAMKLNMTGEGGQLFQPNGLFTLEESDSDSGKQKRLKNKRQTSKKIRILFHFHLVWTGLKSYNPPNFHLSYQISMT